MAVIILHPTEELIFTKLQKELISDLFTEDRILIAARPLWIPINTAAEPVETIAELNRLNLIKIELADLEISDNSIFIPVTITFGNTQYISKLILINLHNGRQFSDPDRKILAQKKQPVRQLKVFRLGIEKELSSNSKCITDSKWIKIR